MEEKLSYEAPKLITYSNDDILDEVGPAQACAPTPCPVGNV
ncbi:MAG: hypothetical protein NT096_10110 [Proteobacteria bacterium]|nr:hypothetical protein [Pseudomonadota bacterium]